MTKDFNNLLEEDLAGRSLSVGHVVDGTVVQISEDGVFVDIGAKSEGHLELDQIFQEELARLRVGDQLKVRIIKKVDGEYKLSKKSVDYENAWNKLKEDKEASKPVEIKVVEKVKNGYMAEAYEILQGFIHHTNFKGRPNIGQIYKANILDLNRKARKLVFTRRDILQVEHEEALERDYGLLQEGMVVEGVVDKLSPYGAFIKITDNLTGLLHISEFSFEHVKKPSEVLKAGDVVQVKILSIDRANNKISLSRKATLKDPLMMLVPGEELDGVVESLADFGVFVKMNNGVTGLVHISELSHRRCSHPSELVKPGEQLRVKVLRVQPEDRRVSLSAKACERDPWTEVYSRYTVGQQVTGHISQLLASGIVMKLDDFFEAFIPISEISEERIGHPGDVHKEEEEVSGVILSIDSSRRRIRVSLRRQVEELEEKKGDEESLKAERVEDLAATAGKVTLGDILGSKLDLTVAKKETEPETVAVVSAPAETETQVVTEVAPEDALDASSSSESDQTETEVELKEEEPAETLAETKEEKPDETLAEAKEEKPAETKEKKVKPTKRKASTAEPKTKRTTSTKKAKTAKAKTSDRKQKADADSSTGSEEEKDDQANNEVSS